VVSEEVDHVGHGELLVGNNRERVSLCEAVFYPRRKFQRRSHSVEDSPDSSETVIGVGVFAGADGCHPVDRTGAGVIPAGRRRDFDQVRGEHYVGIVGIEFPDPEHVGFDENFSVGNFLGRPESALLVRCRTDLEDPGFLRVGYCESFAPAVVAVLYGQRAHQFDGLSCGGASFHGYS
jgi:hypothetical protein